MAVIFHLTDRWDTPLGEVRALSARHMEELNGEDTLEIETFDELSKGNRILWKDHLGGWHEHVVDTVVKRHDDGRPVVSATCVNSIVELWGDYIDDRRVGYPSGTSASTLLTAALEPTRWSVGSGMTSKTGSATFYHTSAREAIQEIQEAVGGELETRITVGTGNVTRRYVAIVDARGEQATAKRFAWSKDVQTISRRVDSSDCISQLYVYGKGEETDAGGYGRRVSIDSVNGGKKYLEDNSAKQQWGRPDGNGGIAHATGVVVFDNVDSPSELKTMGQTEFAKRKTPKLSYTVDVVDLASMGFTYEGVALGDSVTIVDKEFSPELRAVGRVTRIDRDLLDKRAVVTLGNVTENVASILRRQAADLAALKRGSSSWNLIADSDQNYLQQLRGAINDMFDRNSNYQYENFALGSLWSNVPCDGETFKPVQPLPSGTTPWAMNISSAGFRIASSLNANGTWKWSTFGTGEGFVADYITAGVLQSAAYRATGQGDHWILGQRGYLETYSSKFHDSDITNADIVNGTIDNAAITRGSIDRAAITKGTIDDADITDADIDNAYITNSNMVNANVSGVFTTTSGNEKVVVDDSKVKGYKNNTLAGYLDSSIEIEDTVTHQIMRGMRWYGPEILGIITPRFSVADSSSPNATTDETYTGTIRQPLVSSIRDNGDGSITWTSGTLVMRFIHGMLIEASVVGT